MTSTMKKAAKGLIKKACSSQAERYKEILEERKDKPCTKEEQRGERCKMTTDELKVEVSRLCDTLNRLGEELHDGRTPYCIYCKRILAFAEKVRDEAEKRVHAEYKPLKRSGISLDLEDYQ